MFSAVSVDFNKDGWMDLAFTHWGSPGAFRIIHGVGGNRHHWDRQVEFFGVENPALDVVEAHLGCATLRSVHHSLGEVTHDDPAARADGRRGGEAGDAGAGGDLEDLIAAVKQDAAEIGIDPKALTDQDLHGDPAEAVVALEDEPSTAAAVLIEPDLSALDERPRPGPPISPVSRQRPTWQREPATASRPPGSRRSRTRGPRGPMRRRSRAATPRATT